MTLRTLRVAAFGLMTWMAISILVGMRIGRALRDSREEEDRQALWDRWGYPSTINPVHPLSHPTRLR